MYYLGEASDLAEVVSITAVEVFFVLSGFVLGPQIVLCARRRNWATLRTFLLRRWMRDHSVLFGGIAGPFRWSSASSARRISSAMPVTYRICPLSITTAITIPWRGACRSRSGITWSFHPSCCSTESSSRAEVTGPSTSGPPCFSSPASRSCDSCMAPWRIGARMCAGLWCFGSTLSPTDSCSTSSCNVRRSR